MSRFEGVIPDCSYAIKEKQWHTKNKNKIHNFKIEPKLERHHERRNREEREEKKP